MVCDEGIHDQFIKLGEGVCHFCDEVLIKGSKIDVYTCCDNQNIEINKSKKTLKYYKKYWYDVMSLVGDQIHDITNQKRDYKCYLLKV